MAYLRVSRVGNGNYYYIMRSERKGTKVSAKVLEYLGRDPEPARLKRALTYWKVRATGAAGRTKRRAGGEG